MKNRLKIRKKRIACLYASIVEIRKLKLCVFEILKIAVHLKDMLRELEFLFKDFKVEASMCPICIMRKNKKKYDIFHLLKF